MAFKLNKPIPDKIMLRLIAACGYMVRKVNMHCDYWDDGMVREVMTMIGCTESLQQVRCWIGNELRRKSVFKGLKTGRNGIPTLKSGSKLEKALIEANRSYCKDVSHCSDFFMDSDVSEIRRLSGTEHASLLEIRVWSVRLRKSGKIGPVNGGHGQNAAVPVRKKKKSAPSLVSG